MPPIKRSGGAAGLFLTHVVSERVERHYRRLVAESGELVEWHFVQMDRGPRPVTTIPYLNPAVVMPARHRAQVANGGVLGGYQDVAFIPCILALRAEHVWVMEYDVDYSGRWHDLFVQFRDVTADVLTSALRSPDEYPTWAKWSTSSAPAWVDPALFLRSLNPILRLSRRFAHQYALMMSDPAWGHHLEFTIPTAAAACGARIEDLGDESGGRYTPAGRALNYRWSPKNGGGTLVFRPARQQYFHEAPETFAEADRIHHPVKPDVPLWNARPQRRWRFGRADRI